MKFMVTLALSPATAISKLQRAFANPLPSCSVMLLRPGTGTLRRLAERDCVPQRDQSQQHCMVRSVQKI